MKYSAKTAYLRSYVPNAESVDKTTNPYFKNPRAPSIVEMRQSLFWILNQHASVYLCSKQLTKI